MNEVTTIAAAFAFAGFATDAMHVSSSGTALAQTDVANAFLNAGNLASVATGQALSTIPSGAAQAPQAKVDTLANMLASCVSSSGPASASCSVLLTHTLANGATGTTPTDTASAAINIAHNPTLNIASLYSLVTADSPFVPGLIFAPSDLTLGLSFGKVYSPGEIALDAAGAAWITNGQGNSVTKVSSAGAVLSGSSGFAGGGLTDPSSIALDDSGNAWVTSSSSGGSVVKFSNSGSLLSGANGYTAGGLTSPRWIAIDGAGSAWITGGGNSVVKLSSSGVSLSGSTGFTAGAMAVANGIAIDPSGNAWVSNLSGYAVIFELSNSGVLLSGADGYPLNGSSSGSLAIDRLANVWTTAGPPYSAIKIASSGTVLLTPPGDGSTGIAIDGADNVWFADLSDTTVRGLSNSGSPITGTFGYSGGVLTNPVALAVDGSGDIWVVNDTFGSSDGSGLTELIGVAVPVVTPLSTGLKNNTLGTRP